VSSYFSSPFPHQMDQNSIFVSFKIYLWIYAFFSLCLSFSLRDYLLPKFMPSNFTLAFYFLRILSNLNFLGPCLQILSKSSSQSLFSLLISLLLAFPSQLWKGHYRGLLWRGLTACKACGTKKRVLKSFQTSFNVLLIWVSSQYLLRLD